LLPDRIKIEKLKELLGIYKKSSGVEINFSKSQAFPLEKRDTNKHHEYPYVNGIKILGIRQKVNKITKLKW